MWTTVTLTEQRLAVFCCPAAASLVVFKSDRLLANISRAEADRKASVTCGRWKRVWGCAKWRRQSLNCFYHHHHHLILFSKLISTWIWLFLMNDKVKDAAIKKCGCPIIFLFYFDLFKRGVCWHYVSPGPRGRTLMPPFQILCIRDAGCSPFNIYELITNHVNRLKSKTISRNGK